MGKPTNEVMIRLIEASLEKHKKEKKDDASTKTK